MKILVCLAVFFSTAFTLTARGQSPTTSPTVPPATSMLPAPPVAASENAWREFTSLEGRFTILMPGQPTKESRVVDTPIGQVGLEVFELRAETGPYLITYMVTYSDFPRLPDNPRAALINARDGTLKNAQGKLRCEKEVTRDGYPGLEITIDAPSALIKSTLYAVKQRLYQVVILLPPDRNLPTDTTRPCDALAVKFLGSFKILPSETRSSKPVTLPPPKVLTLSTRALQDLAIKQIHPDYPQEARDALASGLVQVQITVSEKGRVIEAKAVSGNPLLYEISVQAAKQWIFKPMKSSGKAVKIQGALTFSFIQEMNVQQTF